MVPVRKCSAKFSRASYVTTALPLPLAFEVITSQLALLTAVQLQPAAAVRLIVPEPPPPLTDCAEGEMAFAQALPFTKTARTGPQLPSESRPRTNRRWRPATGPMVAAAVSIVLLKLPSNAVIATP